MLILRGVLRAATTIGGGISKKTGEAYESREVLQIETLDGRGLVRMDTITVPDALAFQPKIGQEVNIPVRAWASGGVVNFVYEAPPMAPVTAAA